MIKRHFLSLDGLRGVAALSVIGLHTGSWTPNIEILPGANLAVDFFFMLSGFVLDHAYRARLAAGMSTWEFAKVRIIRLYPLIVVGATLGTMVILVSRAFHLGGQWKDAAAFPFAALALPAPFAAQNHFRIDPPEWSLFFEIVANAAFVLGLFRLSLRPLAALTLVLAAAYAWMAWSAGTVVNGQFADHFPLGFIRVAFPFAMGMLLDRCGPSNTRFRLPFWLASILLLASFVPDRWHEHQWMLEVSIVLVLYPAIIHGAQAIDPIGCSRTIATASAFISFPIYILHYPLFEAAGIASRVAQFPWWLWVPVTFVAVVAIAWKAGVWDMRLRVMLNRRFLEPRDRASAIPVAK